MDPLFHYCFLPYTSPYYVLGSSIIQIPMTITISFIRAILPWIFCHSFFICPILYLVGLPWVSVLDYRFWARNFSILNYFILQIFYQTLFPRFFQSHGLNPWSPFDLFFIFSFTFQVIFIFSIWPLKFPKSFSALFNSAHLLKNIYSFWFPFLLLFQLIFLYWVLWPF